MGRVKTDFTSYKTSHDSNIISITHSIALYVALNGVLNGVPNRMYTTSDGENYNLFPEKLYKGDKCQTQYSNMLDCLKNNNESQCEKFIDAMKKCAKGIYGRL